MASSCDSVILLNKFLLLLIKKKGKKKVPKCNWIKSHRIRTPLKEHVLICCIQLQFPHQYKIELRQQIQFKVDYIFCDFTNKLHLVKNIKSI